MCRKCGVPHMPPTGKKCQHRVELLEQLEPEEMEDMQEQAEQPEPVQADAILPLLMEISRRLTNVEANQAAVAESVVEVAATNEPLQAVGGIDDRAVIAPSVLRSDADIMRRAAARIARMQLDDSEEEGELTISTARRKGKKSGSAMLAADVVKQQIDWPHLYVTRMTGGTRVPVPYKQLRIQEFVFGFLKMLKKPQAAWDKELMLDILCMLMQDAMDFDWANVRAFYEMLGLDENDTLFIDTLLLLEQETRRCWIHCLSIHCCQLGTDSSMFSDTIQ